MELIAPNTVYDDFTSEFCYDDGGPDYDWSNASNQYPSDLGAHFLEKLSLQQDRQDTDLVLPDISLSSLNKDQRLAYNLIITTLFNYINNPDSFLPLRLVVSGTACTGKSFLIKCLVHSVRQLFNSNKAVQLLCPTGNSANLISGVTLHCFLKIPTNFKA